MVCHGRGKRASPELRVQFPMGHEIQVGPRAHPRGVGCYPQSVTLLAQTPPDRLVDRQGRPYFLWDMDMSLAEFERRLHDPDAEVRAYLMGKLMRQAKPDDVFRFVSAKEIAALWPQLERYLGRSRPFWAWLLAWWGPQGDGSR